MSKINWKWFDIILNELKKRGEYYIKQYIGAYGMDHQSKRGREANLMCMSTLSNEKLQIIDTTFNELKIWFKYPLKKVEKLKKKKISKIVYSLSRKSVIHVVRVHVGLKFSLSFDFAKNFVRNLGQLGDYKFRATHMPQFQHRVRQQFLKYLQSFYLLSFSQP